jgi:hypothetical protein
MHFDRFLIGEADGYVPQDIAEALLITDTDTTSLLFVFVPFTFLNDSVISMVLN